MIWTDNDTTINVFPVAAGTPLIDRSKDVVVFSMSKDQALGLVGEIAEAFGIASVPSAAAYDRVNFLIEGAMIFPKVMS
jgi:hypothetical protein